MTHLPAEQAFDVLRRRSQQTNVKLRDVANGIIAETVRPDGSTRTRWTPEPTPEGPSP